jgi:NADH-quinone oxidoreductase subunit M
VILSAVYALSLYRRVIFGEITNPALATITDLDKREMADLRPADHRHPLCSASIRIAIFDVTAASVDQLVGAYRAATGG